jgi:hypothetical protein
MKHFIVIYMKKGDRPLPGGLISRQWIEAKSHEDLYRTLCERLHVTQEEVNSQYEIVEIREM